MWPWSVSVQIHFSTEDAPCHVNPPSGQSRGLWTKSKTHLDRHLSQASADNKTKFWRKERPAAFVLHLILKELDRHTSLAPTCRVYGAHIHTNPTVRTVYNRAPMKRCSPLSNHKYWFGVHKIRSSLLFLQSPDC